MDKATPESAPTSTEKIWHCKIGGNADTPTPCWSDGPMRQAVEAAFEKVTGKAPAFLFSGWGASLTEPERAVVENRLPNRAEVERLAAQSAPPMRLVGHCWMEPRGTLRLAETDPPPAGSFPIYTPSQAVAQSAPLQQAARESSVEQEMAMLIRRLCSTTANDKTRAQAMEYLFKRGHASPLRAESAQSVPVQAREYPPLPEGVKARFKCEDCDGTGYTGDIIPGSEFQPPEPVGCTSCNFTGWWAECEAYSADQMHAYLDADRAAAQVEPAELTNDQITAGYLAMLESIEVVGMDRAVQRFRDAVSKGDHQ